MTGVVAMKRALAMAKAQAMITLFAITGPPSVAAEFRMKVNYDTALSEPARAAAQRSVRELKVLVKALPEMCAADVALDVSFTAGRSAPVATAQKTSPRSGHITLAWERVLAEMPAQTLFLFETIVARILLDFEPKGTDEELHGLLALIRLEEALNHLHGSPIVSHFFPSTFLDELARHARDLNRSSSTLFESLPVSCRDDLASTSH